MQSPTLFETLVRLRPEDPHLQITKGRDCVRRGRLDEAIEQAHRSNRMQWSPGRWQNDLILAMAYWQRDQPGDRDRARKLLQSVDTYMQEIDQTRQNGRIQPHVIDWMALNVLRIEAKAMLNDESAPDTTSEP